MVTIRDVIRNRDPYFVRVGMNVLEAAKFMAERKIGGVCVLDDDNRLVGLLTERDLLNSIIVPQRDASAACPVMASACAEGEEKGGDALFAFT